MITLNIVPQYDVLIDEFKSVHKELEAIKNSGYSTAELRKDIEEMEKEKDIVEKRIERMQRKVHLNKWHFTTFLVTFDYF